MFRFHGNAFNIRIVDIESGYSYAPHCLSCSVFVEANFRISAELWFEWKLEECGTPQPRYLSDVAGENRECQDIRCPSRESNCAHTEYKSSNLSSCHPAQYFLVSNVTAVGQKLVAVGPHFCHSTVWKCKRTESKWMEALSFREAIIRLHENETLIMVRTLTNAYFDMIIMFISKHLSLCLRYARHTRIWWPLFFLFCPRLFSWFIQG